MIDTLLEILKASGADGYAITDTTTLAYEFYFIKHELDQNRVRDVEHVEVTVYKKLDDGKMLGSASGEIYMGSTKEEIREEVDKLIGRASNVKNPFFELRKPSDFVPEKSKEVDVSKIAENFVKALSEIPETDTEYLNSYEIFVEKNIRRFVNSEGIDVTFEYPSSMVEVVVNAKKDNHEIELYRLYHAGTCDKEALTKDITKVLTFGKDKLVAKPTPAIGKTAVVFSTSDAASIYTWFADRCSTAYKYNKFTDFEIGKDIFKEVNGDKVNLKGVKELQNSSKNGDFDAEGAVVRDISLIEENVPKNFWGGMQYGYYLNMKDSFIVGNFEVSGGSKTDEEIRSGKFLEIVEFSDFNVDSVTGDIAGEIRLGYYHDGDKVTPVSGGSVSGNLNSLLKNLSMSKDKSQYNNFLIPTLTRLENVSITGAD